MNMLPLFMLQKLCVLITTKFDLAVCKGKDGMKTFYPDFLIFSVYCHCYKYEHVKRLLMADMYNKVSC